jgi:tetratricopeptide (TPR) repeat protein
MPNKSVTASDAPRRQRRPSRAKIELMRKVTALDASKDWQGAIDALDEWLLSCDPKDVEVLLLKGYILDSKHRFAVAHRVYREVLRVSPDNPPALLEVGSYHTNIHGEHGKALRYFSRALRLIEAGRFFTNERDELVEACTEKAKTLLRLRRPLAALRVIVRGLEKYPTDIVLGSALQQAQKLYRATQEKRLGKHYLEVTKKLGIT